MKYSIHALLPAHRSVLLCFLPLTKGSDLQMNASKTVRFSWPRICPWLLGICWVLGMLLGVFSAHGAEGTLIPLIRQSVSSRSSALGALCAALLPFLLSALAVSFSEPWLLLLISSFKAFSFTFCACGVSLAFGQSSWLVRFLFLFSDLCLIPILYLYWLRHLRKDRITRYWELPCCLGWATLICGIDYWFISPFLASIMER